MKTKNWLCYMAMIFFATFVLAGRAEALPQATMPTATPGGGYYTSPVDVVFSSPDSTFFLYTTDGSTPNPSSIQKHGTESLRIESNTVLKAVAVSGSGALNSEVMTETYLFPGFIHRFWSPTKQGHFYTSSIEERNSIMNNDSSWSYEGIAFNALLTQEADTLPVYRFWSSSKQHHFYTISETEKSNVMANDPSWSYEGISYYAYPTFQTGFTRVYRFWSDQKQGHFYTTSEAEKNNIVANDSSWTLEGVAWYLPN